MPTRLGADSLGANAGTASKSMTFPDTGTNRVMLAFGSLYRNGTQQFVTSGGMTWGGVNLTRILGPVPGGAYYASLEVWALVAPTLSAAQTFTTLLTTATRHEVIVAVYSDVDQSTPFGPAATATGTGTTASVTALAADQTASDRVAMFFAKAAGSTWGGGTALGGALTSASFVAEQGGGTTGDAVGQRGLLAEIAGTGTDLTGQATLPSSDIWAAVALAIRAAATGGITGTGASTLAGLGGVGTLVESIPSSGASTLPGLGGATPPPPPAPGALSLFRTRPHGSSPRSDGHRWRLG